MTAPTSEQDLIEAFYNFDRDQDGYLTSEEMKDILLDQGLHMSQQEVEDFIKEADINGDGYIDYKAFARVLMADLEA